MALAVSILITAGVMVGGWSYLERQRTARLMATTQAVTDALAEAKRFHGQAQSAEVGDMTKWSEAIAAANYVRKLLAQGEADDSLRDRVTSALVDLEREQTAAQERAIELERDRSSAGTVGDDSG